MSRQTLSFSRQAGFLVLASMCWRPHLFAQTPARSAEDFFNKLGELTSQAEQFVPAFVREMTPEQQRQLDAVVIDIREERQLGQWVLDAYEEQLKPSGKSVLRHGRDVEYLSKLVRLMQPHMLHARRYRSIRVGLVNTTEPDAYSVPGGDLLFTAGLLDSAESEAALVGVIAHELSHLDRQHQLATLKQTKLAEKSPSARNVMSAIAGVAKPFHAEFESQADEDAFEWMVAAGYNPLELARLLKSWDERQNRLQPWMNAIPSFVRTHPDAGKRAVRIIELDSMQPKREKSLYVGRENLSRRITRQQREFRD